jgi:DNA-binding response OmpR family regulator
MLTAAVQETDIARGFEAGASDNMRKPFSPGELVVRIESLLGSRG